MLLRVTSQGHLVHLEENLRLVDRRTLFSEPDADIQTFLRSNGKVVEILHLPEQQLDVHAFLPGYVEIRSRSCSNPTI